MTPRTVIDARKALNDSMDEESLLIAVTEALTMYGWLWTHTRRSDKALMMGHKGVPDIIAARNGRLKFYELKDSKGNLSTEQFAWQRALPPDHWAIEYRLVRPSDLDDVIASLR